MSKEQIRELIAEYVRQQRSGKLTTAHGSHVDFGSAAHIDDLERALSTLIRLRDRAIRGTSTRKAYSDAVARTRSELKRARKHAERRALGAV